MQLDSDITNKLFRYLLNIIQVGSVSHTILALQTILLSHSDAFLFAILLSKYGLSLIQGLLKRAHDLNLSVFSRDTILSQLPPEIQMNQQLVAAGYHWRDTMKSFMSRLHGRMEVFLSNDVMEIHHDKVWELLALLVIHSNAEDKVLMIAELRSRMQNIPVSEASTAFLQLIGHTASVAKT